MRVYYDRDADPQSHQVQERGRHRLRQPGPRACPEPARFRRQERRRSAAQELGWREKGRRQREAEGHGGSRRRQVGRRHRGADARRTAGRHLQGPLGAQHEAGRGAALRARAQRALRFDRATRRPGRRHGRPEGPGHTVRSEYQRGGGVPCLMAIHQDRSGNAHDLSCCPTPRWASGRSGHHRDDVPRGVQTDLFGEQVVLCGGLVELISHQASRPWSRPATRAGDGLFRVPARE